MLFRQFDRHPAAAPSTISKHVTILKEAGLIQGSSDEQRVCYCVNRGRLQQLQLALGSL